MSEAVPFLQTVSIIGSAFFILGFGALNLGLVNSESYSYQFANIFGALCFTYTAIRPFNAGLFITEAVWALIGVYGVWKIVSIAKKRKQAASTGSNTATGS
ncbi:MAG: hypothetical protein Q4P71_02930 [Actinomycetaceae bacterium]|nr:hypothetical protein [Actinomycetaceae bacterium]